LREVHLKQKEVSSQLIPPVDLNRHKAEKKNHAKIMQSTGEKFNLKKSTSLKTRPESERKNCVE
jgi:hypothetical protein